MTCDFRIHIQNERITQMELKVREASGARELLSALGLEELVVGGAMVLFYRHPITGLAFNSGDDPCRKKPKPGSKPSSKRNLR